MKPRASSALSSIRVMASDAMLCSCGRRSTFPNPGVPTPVSDHVYPSHCPQSGRDGRPPPGPCRPQAPSPRCSQVSETVQKPGAAVLKGATFEGKSRHEDIQEQRLSQR